MKDVCCAFIFIGVFSLASNQEMSYNTVLSVASVGERLLLQEEAVLIAAHGDAVCCVSAM